MKFLNIPTFIFLLMLVTACGKSSSSNAKQVTITPEQIAHLLERQSFECASLDGGRCPEGIARVFILDVNTPNQTALCTGFLSGTNRMVTNHHCLATQMECDNTYVSVFNGQSFEVAKCRSLLIAEDDGKPLNEKGIDYAIFELDRHIRTADFFKPGKTVPKTGDKLTAWVVDHVDLFKGRITELSCTLYLKGNSFQLSECPAISGNSGSPVVNENGNLVGILWGSTTSPNINEETPLHERRELNDQAYVTELKHFRNALTKETNASTR